MAAGDDRRRRPAEGARAAVEVPVEDMAKLGAAGPRSRAARRRRARRAPRSGRHPPAAARADPRAPLDAHLRQQPAARRAPRRALNELAGEELVRSHHGSIAREQRVEIEDALKAGRLRALVATSSLELGIDMGAVDLVVQIEAPPSVASGMQRIGRAGHQVGASSEGVIFPKYRGDLLACAAVTRADARGARRGDALSRAIRSTCSPSRSSRWSPMEPWPSTRCSRSSARRARSPRSPPRRSRACSTCCPAAIRPTSSPSCGRASPGTASRALLTAREGAQRIAVANGGTIPDRGLYGVFLAGRRDGHRARRRARRGDGVRDARRRDVRARRVDLAHRGDHARPRARLARARRAGQDAVLARRRARAGRSSSAARSGGSCASCAALPPPRRVERLIARARPRRRAAENLLAYLADQAAATGACPTTAPSSSSAPRRARRLARVRAVAVRRPRSRPWAMAVVARVREETGARGRDACGPTTASWCACRNGRRRPTRALLLPPADEVEELVVRQLGATALFAARFREDAGRALLLRAAGPARARRSGSSASAPPTCSRSPRATARSRCCSRPTASACATCSTCRRSWTCCARSARAPSTSSPSTRRRRRRSPRRCSSATSPTSSTTATRRWPSGARRRWRSITAQLRELLGEPSCASCSIPRVIEALERQLQHLDERYHARNADGVHDLLLRLGDLDGGEIARALEPRPTSRARSRRSCARAAIVRVPVGGRAALHRGRGRRALPRRARRAAAAGLPEALLQPVRDPLGDLVARYARTHGPFTTDGLRAARSGSASAVADDVLARLAAGGRVLEGEFRPGGTHREWCEADVLRTLRRRSLARLRHEVEPVETDGARAAHDGLAGRAAAARRARRAARRDRAAAGRAAARPRCSRPRSCRRASRATARGSRPADGAPARWCGWASSRSASATAASRSTSPITCARSCRRPIDAGARRARAARSSSTSRRAAPRSSPRFTRRAAAASRRRSSTRCGTSSGTGSSPTTRSTPCARSSRPPPRTRATGQARAFRSRRAAPPGGAGPLVAGRAARSAQRPSPTEWATAHRAAAARPPRRAHARGGRGRRAARRVLDRLRGAEDDGGERAHPARLLRRRASARRSSRCPAALDLLRSVRDEPESCRSCTSRPPIPRTRTARSSSGPRPRAPPRRGARAHAHGGRDGDPRERTARRVSRARRSPAVGVPARSRARRARARRGRSRRGCSSSRPQRRHAAACSSRTSTGCRSASIRWRHICSRRGSCAARWDFRRAGPRRVRRFAGRSNRLPAPPDTADTSRCFARRGPASLRSKASGTGGRAAARGRTPTGGPRDRPGRSCGGAGDTSRCPRRCQARRSPGAAGARSAPARAGRRPTGGRPA